MDFGTHTPVFDICRKAIKRSGIFKICTRHQHSWRELLVHRKEYKCISHLLKYLVLHSTVFLESRWFSGLVLKWINKFIAIILHSWQQIIFHLFHSSQFLLLLQFLFSGSLSLLYQYIRRCSDWFIIKMSFNIKTHVCHWIKACAKTWMSYSVLIEDDGDVLKLTMYKTFPDFNNFLCLYKSSRKRFFFCLFVKPSRGQAVYLGFCPA